MGNFPDSIKRLIDHFDRQSDQVRSPDYNEAQLRIDFINPMFRELGWDVDNTQGFAEQYREVVYEDRVKVGGHTKAPDYSFRIGGPRKFFLEAKKPAVNIKENWEPAYQLRRYGWSAKLAVSLLTNFKELAVYDCRIQPKQLDKASTARREYITYSQYEDRWDFISGTFSKQAVLRGDFDRYCGATRGRGVQEFDEAFLVEIEAWRKRLASNLALRNDSLDERSLNFAVQRTIDRIIFLRICEDRGIERAGRLQALLNGEEVYSRLLQLFRDADDRYNSGLFHFKTEKGRNEAPDELTPTLDIDDASLKSIIERLYYPKSPYEFSVVSADILGSVYERFLGKVITLTVGHRAKIEEKPEVRKAGGVYYTPTYIVDYIVEQTVGKLLETTRTVKEAAKLTILDPACGSGSFLLGAYQYLLDWRLKWYIADGPEKWSRGKRATLRPGRDGQWRLTIEERKRILLDNIHGVDIDYQAVEVTKLSLLLRVLEGETAESLGGLWAMSHERALPDLGQNIQCGNSLIATDIIGAGNGEEMSEDEHRRVNAFDFTRSFSRVMKRGGFDVVVGNPPYVRQESIKESKAYFESHYRSFDSTADLYVYFIERGSTLLRAGGLLSYIVSSSFLRSNFGERLREHLCNEFAIVQLVDFGGLAVFEDAKDTYVCIPLIARRAPSAEVRIARLNTLTPENVSALASDKWYSIPASHVTGTSWSLDRPEVTRLFERISNASASLGKILANRIYRGVITGLNEAFELDADRRESLIAADRNSAAIVRRFLGGQDIRRYHTDGEQRYLVAVPCGYTRREMAEGANPTTLDERTAWRWFTHRFPGVAAHLAPFADAGRRRADQGEFWWELRPCDYYNVMDGPKIIYPDITKNPRFHLDTQGVWIRNTAYCLDTHDPYLLGLLNSRFLWYCVARISIPFGTRAGEYRYRMFTQYVTKLPIADASGDRRRRDRVCELANTLISLHGEEESASLPQTKEQIRRRIEAADHRIEQLVHELYGLTDEEIRIVELATATE